MHVTGRLMIASGGSTIVGSARSSNRMSCAPYNTAPCISHLLSWRGYARDRSVQNNPLFLKEFLRKVVQAAAHDPGVVPIGVHAPDVRHTLFRQVVVHPLADAVQVVV